MSKQGNGTANNGMGDTYRQSEECRGEVKQDRQILVECDNSKGGKA